MEGTDWFCTRLLKAALCTSVGSTHSFARGFRALPFLHEDGRHTPFARGLRRHRPLCTRIAGSFCTRVLSALFLHEDGGHRLVLHEDSKAPLSRRIGSTNSFCTRTPKALLFFHEDWGLIFTLHEDYEGPPLFARGSGGTHFFCTRTLKAPPIMHKD